jgi:hypothetical protein
MYVHGQQLSSEVGSVAVELDLSVGADVEGAVPSVPDEAVADGEVLNAFEREARCSTRTSALKIERAHSASRSLPSSIVAK